jgi:hypothetical protein
MNKTIDVICVTWNVGGTEFEPQPVVAEIQSADPVPIVAIALQEIVLTEFLVEGHAMFLMDSLRNRMSNVLTGYELVHIAICGAVALCIFFCRNCQYALEFIKGSAVFHSTGSRCKGKSSIWATISIKCAECDRIITLIGSHFEPNNDGYDIRNEEWNEICSEVCGKSDYIVLMGDLNYRIDLPRNEVLRLIKEQKYGILLEKDQLRKIQRENSDFASFKEAEIRFAPTYKFDIGLEVYDTSEKQRIPSYTDRVLIACREGVADASVEDYRSVNDHQSDHEPLFCRVAVPFE